MRNVDFQIVHTQTPAVERSYQTRQAQVDHEQRQATTIQQQAADQKMQETQSTPQTEGAKVQLEKEKQRRSRKRKKKQQQEQEIKAAEKQQEDTESSPKRIDIRI